MWTNATVTIKRRGVTHNGSTGYRETDVGSDVLADAECVFSQNKGARRRVNQDGLREAVKPVYGVLIPDAGTAEIKVGDQATIAHEGITRTFTVNDAVKSGGVSETHWELTVETLKLPN